MLSTVSVETFFQACDTLNREAVGIAPKREATIAMDVNLFPKLWGKGVLSFALLEMVSLLNVAAESM